MELAHKEDPLNSDTIVRYKCTILHKTVHLSCHMLMAIE